MPTDNRDKVKKWTIWIAFRDLVFGRLGLWRSPRDQMLQKIDKIALNVSQTLRIPTKPIRVLQNHDKHRQNGIHVRSNATQTDKTAIIGSQTLRKSMNGRYKVPERYICRQNGDIRLHITIK